MSGLWIKEWREFAGNGGPLICRLGLSLALLGPLAAASSIQLPVLMAAIAYLGTFATASQVVRERSSGLLPRLALTPATGASLLLHRIISRSLLLVLQILPLVGVAVWAGAPPALLWIALPLAPAACAAGVLMGLGAASRRGARMAGLSAVLAAPGGALLLVRTVIADPPGIPGDIAGMSLSLPVPLALWLMAAAAVGAALRAAPHMLTPPEP